MAVREPGPDEVPLDDGPAGCTERAEFRRHGFENRSRKRSRIARFHEPAVHAWLTLSGRPPARVAITGLRCAMASSVTSELPS